MEPNKAMEQKKCCPACGAELEPAVKGLSLGGDGWGLLTSALVENLEVDAYVCPNCGKVELYRRKSGL